MAIDSATLTSLADTLKTVYGDGITNQFADEVTTYNQFPKSSVKPAGEGFAFGVRYERAQNAGARLEGELLPAAVVGKYDKGLILPKSVYSQLQITGNMIDTAISNLDSFVLGLAGQVDDTYQALLDDLNRQCWGDGFGLIGTLSAASDSLSTSAAWTATLNNTRGVQYVRDGMIVDFYDGANVDQSSTSCRVSYSNTGTKVVTFEGNDGTYKAVHPITAFRSYTITTAAVPDGAYMVKQGAREAVHATSNTARELTGLLGIYDDGTLISTFENIAVASHPKWAANILSNSGVERELSIDLMLQAINKTRQVSGKKVDILRMGLGQRRKYANLLINDRRFMDSKLKGGYEELSFAAGDGTVTIIIDRDAQPGMIFFEPKGVIEKYELTPIGWVNEGKLLQTTSYDVYTMALKIRTNLGVQQRNCLTVLKDLVEPTA